MKKNGKEIEFRKDLGGAGREKNIYELLKTNFLIVKSILMRKKHPNMTS